MRRSNEIRNRQNRALQAQRLENMLKTRQSQRQALNIEMQRIKS